MEQWSLLCGTKAVDNNRTMITCSLIGLYQQVVEGAMSHDGQLLKILAVRAVCKDCVAEDSGD